MLRSELLAAGLSQSETTAAGDDGLSDGFYPCSRVWPMGFSWSSCFAQETLLAICNITGLDSQVVLANDAPLPRDLSIAFAVATDDLMVFWDLGPGHTTDAVSRFEQSLRRATVLKNPDKDIDDSLNTTCVGVDLVDGCGWAPPGARSWSLVDAATDRCAKRVASPASVAAFLGVAQWFNLLRRLRLSVYRCVYDFFSGAKATDWTVVELPDGVVSEILLDTTMSLFGTVNMRLPFLPLIGATDASTVFGLGGTVARLETDQVRDIAHMACKRGGHTTLSDGPELSDALLARLGKRHHLGLELRDFDVIFSVRITEPGHINLEEARALVLYVKWVLRRKERFCHRVVVLVDSKVVIGAATKGRSSSQPLNAILRRLAALCFAGGLVLHCVFISTSHNPGDWPSRGGPELRRRRRLDRASRCPACGALPEDHPQDVPRRLRGGIALCRGIGERYAYIDGDWVSDADLSLSRLICFRRRKALLGRCFTALAGQCLRVP